MQEVGGVRVEVGGRVGVGVCGSPQADDLTWAPVNVEVTMISKPFNILLVLWIAPCAHGQELGHRWKGNSRGSGNDGGDPYILRSSGSLRSFLEFNGVQRIPENISSVTVKNTNILISFWTQNCVHAQAVFWVCKGRNIVQEHQRGWKTWSNISLAHIGL